MLKKIFLFTCSFILVAVSFAQNKVEIDERLFSVFPQEKLEYLQQNAPKDLAFMNFMLDHSLEIIEASTVQVEIQDLPTTQIDNLESLNYYELKVSQQPNSNNYYLIEGTNSLLLVKSYNSVKEMFKNEFYKD